MIESITYIACVDIFDGGRLSPSFIHFRQVPIPYSSDKKSTNNIRMKLYRMKKERKKERKKEGKKERKNT